jgi:hypothetical protein
MGRKISSIRQEWNGEFKVTVPLDIIIPVYRLKSNASYWNTPIEDMTKRVIEIIEKEGVLNIPNGFGWMAKYKQELRDAWNALSQEERDLYEGMDMVLYTGAY